MKRNHRSLSVGRDCEKDPCEICQRREAGETCGSCFAGILVGVNGNEVQRCDECALFETDEDAVIAMLELAKLLHETYVAGLKRGSYTVADAMDKVADAVRLQRAVNRKKGGRR